MDRKERINRLAAKEDLLELIKTTTGSEPPGIRHFLTLLTHDEIVDAAVDFLTGSKKVSHKCEIYPENGWSCIQEYEAKIESVWRAKPFGEDPFYDDGAYHEMWCDPCRQRYLSRSDELG